MDRNYFEIRDRVTDLVNNPPHYQRGGLEAIDVIEAFELDYHTGNAVKYLLRAGYKDDLIQDLQKAVWYLQRRIEKLASKDASHEA